MDINDEKALLEPSADGPKFRPAKGLLWSLGGFLIFAGLACLWPAWNLLYEYPVNGFPSDEEVGLSLIMGGCFTITAVVLIFHGIGSILFKNGARKSLLALGWFLVGVAGMVALVLIMTGADFMRIFTTPTAAGIYTPNWKEGALALAFMAAVPIVGLGGPAALLIVVYRSRSVRLTTKYFDRNAGTIGRLSIPQLILVWFHGFCLVWLTGFVGGMIYPLYDSDLLSHQSYGYIFTLINFLLVGILLIAAIFAPRWAWWGSWLFVLLWGGMAYLYKSYFDFDAYLLETFNLEDYPEEHRSLYAGMIESQRAGAQFVYRSALVGIYIGALTLAGYLIYSRKAFLGSKRSKEADLPE